LEKFLELFEMGSYKNLLKNESLILQSIRNILKENSEKDTVIDEATTLRETNTPEFKEGLVIYFSSLPTSGIKSVEDKLNKPENNQKKIVLPEPENDELYGAKSYGLVLNAVKHLSDDIVKTSEKAFYYNALSVAKKIQEVFKGPTQADRGDVTYSKLRNKAVQLIKDGYELSITADKWCPADIYIYNDSNVPSKMLNATSLNIGDDSFNAYFQSQITNTSDGLIGISLKEEKAQAGKATSFFKTLERKENYPDAPKLSGNSKYVLSISYNFDQAVKFVSKDAQRAIGYIATAHASAEILSSKLKEAEPIKNDLFKILKTTLGASDLKSIKNANGRYDKDDTRELFANKNLDTFVIPSGIQKNIDKLNESFRKKAEAEYKKTRKVFIDVLKQSGMEAPTETPDLKSMGMETVLKKTSCYMVAGWVLDGLNSKKLNIPNVYQTIIKEKNAFVAMTAYAIGMAGISPTFFKMIGNSKGGTAHLETFYGSGFLNLDEKQKVIIGDSPGRKGFFVEFITTVKLDEKKSTKPVSKYKVSLDFRYAGEAINIEVSELKEV
jgi:hypothetical protein